MRKIRLSLILACVMVAGLTVPRIGGACIVVKLPAREVLHSAKAVYRVEFSEDHIFDVVSTWIGPRLKRVHSDYLWGEAVKSCTPQEWPEVGRQYIFVAYCQPQEIDSPVTYINCESIAYPIKDFFEDYVRYLDEPCIVTRSEIIDLLDDWKVGDISTSELSGRLTRLNDSCDVDDWYGTDSRWGESISAEVLSIMHRAFSGLIRCEGIAANLEERVSKELMVPLVSLLQSDKVDPNDEEIETLLDNCQDSLDDIFDLECEETEDEE